MLTRTHCFIGGVRQRQVEGACVTAAAAILLNGTLQHLLQPDAQHPIAPNQYGAGVALAQHRQKVAGGILQAAHILGVVAAVRQCAQLVRFAGHGVEPRRIAEGVFIVGGEVYNDCIGLPCRKIVLPFSPEGGVVRTLRHAANLLVIGRQGMVRVIVPPADDAPATLGDKAVLSPERIGGQAGVVVFGAEKGTDPILLLPGAQRTLAAGDAVSHKSSR